MSFGLQIGHPIYDSDNDIYYYTKDYLQREESLYFSQYITCFNLTIVVFGILVLMHGLLMH